MVDAPDIQYRSLSPGEEFDHTPFRGRPSRTVPLIVNPLKRSMQECARYGGAVRRSATFYDVAKLRVESCNLDASLLPHKEQQKWDMVHKVWDAPITVNNVRIWHPSDQVYVAEGYLDVLLKGGIQELPEGWRYTRRTLHGDPDAVQAAASALQWLKFSHTSEALSHDLDYNARRSNEFWRAVLHDIPLHHEYVMCAEVVAKMYGGIGDAYMGIYFDAIPTTGSRLKRCRAQAFIIGGLGSDAADLSRVDDGGRLDEDSSLLIGMLGK